MPNKYTNRFPEIYSIHLADIQQITLHKCPAGYFFYQTQQNESEFIFEPEQLREMCEYILHYLDNETESENANAI